MRSGAIASGLLACLALLSALAPPAVSAPGQNYCRGVVLYDMAHGETDGRYTDGMDCGISVPELLEEWGCQVELNYQPLDQVDLSGYDLLVIYSPHSEFSDAETAAIEEYVRRGGSLLLLVDTQMAYGNQAPNQVAEKFGARFAGDEVETCEISAPYHPIAFDLSDEDLFNPFLLWDAYVSRAPDQAEVVVRSASSWIRALAAPGNESARAMGLRSGGLYKAMVAFRHGLGKVVLGPRNGLGQPTGGPWYNRPGEENRVLAATVKWLTDKDAWLVRLIYDYFPVLMFSRGERWYPTSFYFDGDAELTNNYENYHEGAPYYVYVHVANATIRWWRCHPYAGCFVERMEEGIAVEYWFYSVYNRFPGDTHEHEWESVFVFFVNESGRFMPVGVKYNRHAFLVRPGRFSWDELLAGTPPGVVGGTHPAVVVANGSHASYAPFECSDGRCGVDKWYGGGSNLSWRDIGKEVSLVLAHSRMRLIMPFRLECRWISQHLECEVLEPGYYNVSHETLNGTVHPEERGGLWPDHMPGNDSEFLGVLFEDLEAPWIRDSGLKRSWT